MLVKVEREGIRQCATTDWELPVGRLESITKLAMIGIATRGVKAANKPSAAADSEPVIRQAARGQSKKGTKTKAYGAASRRRPGMINIKLSRNIVELKAAAVANPKVA